MKIIYEDGEGRNENENIPVSSLEFEDVSSDSVRTPGDKKPVRPVRRPAPTLRDTGTEKKETAAEAPPAAPVAPVYGQPYTAVPQQGYPPQGYVPQGYMQGTLPPQQPYYPQYPYGGAPQQGYIPQQYSPYPPVYPPQPAPSPVEGDPGTRVLYQSPDFDRPEGSERPVAAYPQQTYAPPVIRTGIAHEDVDYGEENLPSGLVKKKPVVRPSASRRRDSFDESDVEMSVFELNAMGQANKPTVKAVRQPGSEKQGIGVEELEQEISELEDFGQDEAYEEDGKKKLPLREVIRRVVLGISLTLIVITSAMLINQWRLSEENKDLESEISDLIIDVTEPSTTKKPKKDKNNKTTKPAGTTEPVLTPAQQWEQIKAEYPNVIFPVDLQLKYARLYATNQDFVGYLSAEGVKLSLPVVQTDNDDDYMNKNFYGKSTKYGCPFVTHLNNITELDMNTVIFGHHMNNGTVFGALDAYKSIEGFKKAPVITFNTYNKDYKWKVIAAFVTNAYEKDDNGYIFRYYFTSLSTQERFAAFLNELSQRSLYDTGVDVLPTDKILTLSTCSHEFTDARFVVVARLVRNGESAEVDVLRAVTNPNPRYPQAYYDKKGTDNPYKDASRWEVG